MRSRSRQPIIIHPAQILWENNAPYSKEFGDIYFSRSGGISESEHVYLEGNDLPRRFQTPGNFVVGELGFGTGLNFFLTMKSWSENSKPSSQLFYLSFELHPLSRTDLERALTEQLGEDPLIALLLERYPLAIEGLHVVHFEEYRTTLMLNLGDAAEKLPETTASVDAWYLDGFSPEKNPGLWSEEVLNGVTALSYHGTTAATYSVSGAVRERLTRLGWRVEKVPGIGGKKQVLRAECVSAPEKTCGEKPSEVTIIGAGVAGCTAAEAFHRRGIQTRVLDRHGLAAQEASGNSEAAVFPYLSAERDDRHRFYLAGFLYLLSRLRELHFEWNQCGALYTPFRERQREMLEGVSEFGFPDEFLKLLTSAAASEIAGVPVERPAMYFSLGGAVQLPKLCSRLLKGIPVERVEVLGFESGESCWNVIAKGGNFKTQALVLAGGSEQNYLPPFLSQALSPLKGEIGMAKSSAVSKGLRTILCGDGYVLPQSGGRHMVGATYYREVRDTVSTEEGKEKLGEIFHRFFPAHPNEIESMRASIRGATYDRMPFAGLVPQEKSALLLTLGHGSRGGVSAPIAAEAVAAKLCGEPLPIEKNILQALDPARVLRRQKRELADDRQD